MTRSAPAPLRAMRSHPARTQLGLMLALTFSTGVIDAVGYLGLDRVFTANMTGNVVILGMALTGADGLPVLGPAVALLGFALGAAAAGRVLRGAKDTGWNTRTTLVFLAVGVTLALVAVLTGVLPSPGEPVLAVITAVLAVSMGLQAGAARQVAVKDVTTVVVTSTLTGLAADSIFGARASKHPWPRRLGAIALIGAGAAVGALTLHVGLWFGIAVSAAFTLVVAAIGHFAHPAPPALPDEG
ncbi:YoaK family protein [Microbacterium sp. B2969]|uniref:YoaK family protein n=1 Tax=Microbacterium alkaliflavum TaxID=3248839 RepID=A0ABW7QCT8_9MICO